MHNECYWCRGQEENGRENYFLGGCLWYMYKLPQLLCNFHHLAMSLTSSPSALLILHPIPSLLSSPSCKVHHLTSPVSSGIFIFSIHCPLCSSIHAAGNFSLLDIPLNKMTRQLHSSTIKKLCFTHLLFILYTFLGVKMSCMKNLVLSEPVVDIVDPNTALTSNCVIKVSII